MHPAVGCLLFEVVAAHENIVYKGTLLASINGISNERLSFERINVFLWKPFGASSGRNDGNGSHK